MQKLSFTFVNLGSVQYDQSVQYARGLLHAALTYGTHIDLTLIDRIHHEINRQRCTSFWSVRGLFHELTLGPYFTRP